MSQKNLAFAADVDCSYISEIELAKSSASVAILERIAPAMDLDIIDLFCTERLTMPDPHATRLSAAPIGRIRCFETGLEIGLLYRWGDGAMQVALHNEGPTAMEVADSLVENSNC